MKKICMMEILSFGCIYILNSIIAFILSLFVKKNNNYLAFNIYQAHQNKYYFMGNVKYLYLYANKLKKFHVTLLCNDRNIIKIFNNYGYKNIYSTHSIKGIYYALKSKYWFYNSDTIDLPRYLIFNAVLINLWHGAGGLKKIGIDDEYNPINKVHLLIKNIYNFFKLKASFFIVNSNFEAKCRKSAYNVNDDKIKLLSSPRLDILYNDIPNSEMFLEEDFNKIKSLKEQGKKLIIYMPTWRDTKKDISSWLNSIKLKEFLIKNNIILICKLHPLDINSLNVDFGDVLYKMKNNSDVYPILKYTDALITDYSSVYFDYLHLNKPIIYYIPDIKEYKAQCREFYRAFETLTAGEYAKTEDEILRAIQNVVSGIDKYYRQRKTLLDEMFIYQDGNNCKRIIEWIKSLDI